MLPRLHLLLPLVLFSAAIARAQPIGDLTATLRGANGFCNKGFCPFGSFLGTGMLALAPTINGFSTTPDFVLVDSGFITADLPAGHVLPADVNNALPRTDFAVQVTMTGAQLFSVLEDSVAATGTPEFIQIGSVDNSSALTTVYDTSAPAGSQLKALSYTLNGLSTEIGPNDTTEYTVIMPQNLHNSLLVGTDLVTSNTLFRTAATFLLSSQSPVDPTSYIETQTPLAQLGNDGVHCKCGLEQFENCPEPDVTQTGKCNPVVCAGNVCSDQGTGVCAFRATAGYVFQGTDNCMLMGVVVPMPVWSFW